MEYKRIEPSFLLIPNMFDGGAIHEFRSKKGRFKLKNLLMKLIDTGKIVKCFRHEDKNTVWIFYRNPDLRDY